MKTTLPLLLIAAFSTGAVLAQNEAKKKEGPERFADAIAKFEANEAKNPPPKDAILFVGSSSIRLWDLEKSFPGRVTLNRGFGGSTLADSIHYFDRIIAPHAPKAIVIYAGDNDVNRGLNADEVFADYKTLIGLIEKKLPGTPVIYIAIKPSIKRWEMWPTMKAANDMIAALSAEKSHLYFADIGKPMLDTDDGKPNPEWFKDDGLHLNDAGYAAWAKVIRPLIEKAATAGR